MNISRRMLNLGVLNLGVASLLTMPLIAVPASAAANPDETKFAQFAKKWLADLFKESPVWATQIGDHSYDHEIDDMSNKGIEKSLKNAKESLVALYKINKENLSAQTAIDYALLENHLKFSIWKVDTLREWEWNPLFYQSTIGSAVYSVMARPFSDVKTRIKSALARMKKSGSVMAQMRANLIPAKVPEPYALTYVGQNKGLKSIVEELLKPELGVLSANEKAQADKIIADYYKVIDENQNWIEKSLVPAAKADFRCGAKIFDEQLDFVLQSNLKRDDIKKMAWDEIKTIRATMFEIAKPYYNGVIPSNPDEAMVQKVIENAFAIAASDRPARDKLVETSTAMTEVARKFVIEKDLITLPDGKVKVILMPEFQRGYAAAYCDSPGPLEKHLETFYAVSPIPDDWNQAQADSFLKEYNMRGIQDIAVHEAMPGHYVQIFHANSYPSVLRAVLSNGNFVEGWAVYAEHMMVEQGFKSDDPLYRLTQLKVLLRTITNALIDQEIHCNGMSEAEMMTLLTKTAFQEESEARGKWRRAQLSFTQLSTYFVGYLEHIDARKAYEAKMGDKFNLKTYHDGILAFGSPPMKYAKTSLLTI